MTKTSHSPVLLPVLLGLMLPTGALISGCEKDEPPPPLPTAAPATTASAPPAQLILPEEDAGIDAGQDAGPKKVGGGAPRASLANCCKALEQNAASAPPPNNTYMLQAAATCNAFVAAGKDKNSIVAAIQGALRSAPLPLACR